LFNKRAEGNIGESWELSAVPENISMVEGGDLKGISLQELIETHKGNLVGDKVYQHFGNTFPLLFKFIDAREDLSVQLHPDDDLAKQRHDSFGKTEMWYIMNAESDARLILGFNDEIDGKKYDQALAESTITSILNSEIVKQGDAFFIAPGTVHAIGAGVLLAEIQQTSDITYRIYDWNRPDTNGTLRELHTDQALEAINFGAENPKIEYVEEKNKPVLLKNTPFFETNLLKLTNDLQRDLSSKDSFVVYMCTEGAAVISTKTGAVSIEKGQTILVPACLANLLIKSESATLLEVYIP